MANPLTTAGFPDVLDPRFREITDGEFADEQDRISEFYSMETPSQLTERWSSLSPMGLYNEFSGAVNYDGPDQQYDVSATHREYAKGVEVERLLVEFDQFGIIDTRFKLLARSARQSRQVHAARIFNNAFSNDTTFYNHSEAVALCSNSHTTERSGVSTSTGFDNLVTSALSPTALRSAYTQFRKFKDAAGQPIDGHAPGMLLVPVDLRDRADEIVRTKTGLDTAEGNVNTESGRYNVVDWIRLTDSNNWFICNQPEMKDSLKWFDKVPVEFARVEDFDTVQAKYRGYMVYTLGYGDWRFILGGQVS
jgi:hypothetical protein